MKNAQSAGSNGEGKDIKAVTSTGINSPKPGANRVTPAGINANKTVARTKVARLEQDPAVPVASRQSKSKRPTGTNPMMEPDLQQLIRQEAYFRAERRGFIAGNDWQDWFEAEQHVYRLLKRALPKH